MAKNPDPTLDLSTATGVTRTLDDWTTMFHLCLVILPDRPEASEWIPVARRIFGVLGDSDARTAFVIPSTPAIAERILGDDAGTDMVFVDPDRSFVTSLGLEHLPAFVHIRQDTSVGTSAEGWDPAAWQKVARDIAKAMAWTVPDVAPPGGAIPRRTAGWAV
ncbi:MAG: hypothetical protein JJE46_07495 [Acidimicrobiia bacterium]|nr:hypothetical protein [Acidimicrobiia bacterium]